MKKWMAGAVGVIAALALFGVALADAENGSFETGDGVGWDPNPGAAGQIIVDTNCASFCTTANPFFPYAAVDGTYFAYLVGGNQDEYTTLSQDVDVRSGDIIDGYVFFHDQEALGQTFFCDTGEIRILEGDDVIATLFSENACGLGEDSTDWTYFSYEATESTTLTIEARVANLGDSIVSPVLGIDAVTAGSDRVRVPIIEERPRNNVAGGIAGIFTPSQAIAPATGRAPAVTPPSTGTGVTIVPPSTGNAGLADQDSASSLALVVVVLTVAAAGLKVGTLRA